MDSDEHLDPTAEISLETVKQRSVRGVVTLTGRYFVLYGISLVSQGFLGAFLSIVEFGIFGVVSAFVNFLVYFSDIGLAASLIQKKEKATEDDLKTTFTVQQLLVFTIIGIILLFSNTIRGWYNLSPQAVYLMYALAFSLFASSVKTIPSVLLERKLEFEKLALASIIENLVYNIVLVVLAWKGMGINSFTIAVLARAVVGVTALYILEPWKPKLGISRTSLHHLLRYGIPYQLNTFLAVLKDDGLALVLGKTLGLSGMGILLWSQKWAQMPLRLFMDTVTKVTFPAFARMQDDKDALARGVTRSLFFISFFVFPSVVGLVLLAPVLIQVIPRYDKWAPALLPLAIVSVNTLFAAVTTQITNLLNSIGKIKITFMLMIMWTLLSWATIPALAYQFGVVGAASGYAIVGASSIIAIGIAKRHVGFSLMDSIARPLVASIGMGAVLLVARSLLPHTLASVGALVGIGASVYVVLILILVGVSLVDDAKKAYSTLFSK